MKRLYCACFYLALFGLLAGCQSGSSSSPSIQDSEPADTVETISLSSYEPTGSSGITWNSTEKTLAVVNVEYFRFKLSTEVDSGSSIDVHVTGTNNGTVGFRSWLVNSGNTTLSNVLKTDSTFVSGAFDLTYTLTSNGAATYLYFKGPAYGTNIDSIVIKSIEVTYTAGSTSSTTPDPTTPATAQDPNTTSLTLAASCKSTSGTLGHNPLVTQDFIADPTAIEYNGRLYVFGTHDVIEFDSKGNVVSNAYNTATLYCISSADLVNWTDHGLIAVSKIASWASKSWAPSICTKVIGGTQYYFLYFANGANGIGVLRATSPLGPWTDPNGKALITSSTTNCSSAVVPWLFDPGVLVDDDGTGYLYFGGGQPASATKASPKSSRVVKLGADMTSLDGDPVELDPYYLFEDNEINKIGTTYYYSYCTNWSCPDGGACIGYMTSDSPMSGFTYKGILLKNPGSYFGNYYNNHHKLIQFNGTWYVLYHSTLMEERLYGTKMGYRSLHMDKLTVGADGALTAAGTYAGVDAIATLDPYTAVSATTMAWQGGLRTVSSASKSQMVIDSINTGDWLGLENVAFGTTGAKNITVSLASTTASGSIEVYVGGTTAMAGTKVATIPLKSTGGLDTYEDVTAALSQTVTGTQPLYLVFRGVGYHLAGWQFSH